MTDIKTWVLTDTAQGIWMEELELTSPELGVEGASVRKRVLRGGLCDGVDVIEVDNGAFQYTILPTRGMGIWRGSYKGLDVGWQSPVAGPVHPGFVDLQDRGKLGWLTGFDEAIVRCGLDNNGGPAVDIVPNNMGVPSEVELTLHGRIANLPAHRVEIRVEPGDEPTIKIIGIVDEAALFYPGFRLHTEISTTGGANAFTIVDTVTNLKATDAEFELLYHCNFGPPFLEAGSRLEAPARLIAPRDPRAVEGIDTYAEYLAPTDGYIEQVYWYEPLATDAGATLAMLRNADGSRGVIVRYNTQQMPCFSQWKNTASMGDGYVTGLEPGTDHPNSKTFEREQGRLMSLAPGASHEIEMAIEVQDTATGVQAIQEEIAAIQGSSPTEVRREPLARLSG
ncbi:MAG: aldose 1-epimerase family protein [Gemmatimonadetes bacterium]|jgi:galactose mutarotase-like enzyme|nr:aldose 1-epimerase family protein [Gemmatimonadota bacterium]MBT6148040.1 aldose 1-epimerase family protein [Gemmatimonadota bacterium]MBT7861322.1 aldose 1-epimerase family protein [Gemmatimonadota bacterium]